MTKRKLTAAQKAAKAKTRQAKIAQANNAFANAMRQKARDIALHEAAQQALREHSYPEINDKRPDCQFSGHMRISLSRRQSEIWKIGQMRFYGDWAIEDKREELLPALTGEGIKRDYQFDFQLKGVLGEEYETPTYVIKNIGNMAELERQADALCHEIATAEGYLLDLDNCFFEVRA